MTVRDSLTPCQRTNLPGGSAFEPVHLERVEGLAPAGLSPEAREWIAWVQRRCDQAAIVLVFLIGLWFLTASIGASLP